MIMAACYFMKVKRDRHPVEVVAWLKAKRKVVSLAVAKYPTVLRFHDGLHSEQAGVGTVSARQ